MRIAVVGGGVAGLAAAAALRKLAGPDLELVVLERAARLGGKLRTGQLAGAPVETGAETFLTTESGAESAALRLAREVGLGDELIHPAPVPAAIVDGGALRPLPAGTLLGIPADPSTLDGYRIEDRDHDRGHPVLTVPDVAVGELVADRYGADLVRRLVDPLLGGVYAGAADRLSLAATMPALHGAAQSESTLGAAVRSALEASGRRPGQPVFASVRGGLSRYVDAIAASAGAQLSLGTTVRGLARTGDGYELTTGSTRDESRLAVDGVVLAVPGAPAARLLERIDAVAAPLRALEYASVVLVTLALPPGTVLPALSGFLVPATEGLAIKAATFFTTKWARDEGPVLVRASLGRHGDVSTLQQPDAALLGTVRRELGMVLDLSLPEPVDELVTRWGGALPQYGVGHVAAVAAARSALPAGLALAGAAYDGVGIAACVRSGEAAGQAVWASLTQSVA